MHEKWYALADDRGVIRGLIVASQESILRRDQGDWLDASADEDDVIGGLQMIDATPTFLHVYDAAMDSSGVLTDADVT